MSDVNALTTNTNAYYSAAGLQSSTLGTQQQPAVSTDVAATARLPPPDPAVGVSSRAIAANSNSSLSAAVSQASLDAGATLSVSSDQNSGLSLTVNQSNGDVQQFPYQSGSLLSTSA